MKSLRSVAWISATLSTVVFLVTLSILFVWLCQPGLKAVASDAMKPNTALGLVLLSMSLWFRGSPSSQWRPQLRTAVPRLLAFWSLVTGALTLAQYAFGFDFAIDELMAKDFPTVVLFPGRMASLEAGLLCSMSLSLIGTDKRFPRVRIYADHLFALPVIFISMLTLIGYVYGVQTFFQMGTGGRVTWPTALCFFALGLGALFTSPAHGLASLALRQTVGGKAFRNLMPAAVSLPLVLGALSIYLQNAGILDNRFAMAFMVSIVIASFCLFIVVVSRNLDVKDRERSLIDDDLTASLGHASDLQQRIQIIFQNIAARIWAIDTTETFTFYQGGLGDQIVVDPNERLGRNISEVFKGQEELLKAIRQALSGRKARIDVCADGRWFETTLSPIFDADKKIRGVIGIAVDITDRRKVTESLKEAKERLELSVQERTQELTVVNSLLQKKNKDLADSNQDLEDFAHIASHDLKEPLRGIGNYATFLLEDYFDKLDDAGKQKLQTLPRLVAQLEGLIDSLFYFSRVGRAELAFKDTDLAVVLAEVLDSLHITLEESGVEVEVDPGLPQIVCDRARIAEIFRNLITNAMKYNDKDQKKIQVGLLHGPETTFYVRDNGIGIRPEHMEPIFKIFKRLHGRNKFGGGSGLGLTIVRKIVERHGGRIWLESTPGTGTTFFLVASQKPCPIRPKSEVTRRKDMGYETGNGNRKDRGEDSGANKGAGVV